MIHAMAMLAGLWVLWLLIFQAWSGLQAQLVAAAAAAASTLIAARFGAFRGGGVFAFAPTLVAMSLARAGRVVSGALATVRAAIAADVTLKPALVLVRSRATRDHTRAALAQMISATPTTLAVETDSDGILLHVLNEDAVDAEALTRLEGRVMRTLEGGGGA